ncbi:hypothetical protein ACIOC2_19345 [Streptomyces sp. NPDC088337]|uniref:hypothetical protein n=1 Tax=unclassified Streptomyces TaxID=2593676 RepID=UPI00380191D5
MNLATSVVCFCIGLPVALFVISRLQEQMTGVLAEKRAEQRARVAGRLMTQAVLGSFTKADAAWVRAELQQIKALHAQMRSCFHAPAPYKHIPPTGSGADRYQDSMLQRNQQVEDLTGVKVSYYPAATDWTGAMLEGWRQCQRVQEIAADCGLQWPEQSGAISLAWALPALGRGPQDAFRAVPFNSASEEVWERREAELDAVDRWLDAMTAVLDALPGLAADPQTGTACDGTTPRTPAGG